jgi:hypothetical protein
LLDFGFGRSVGRHPARRLRRCFNRLLFKVARRGLTSLVRVPQCLGTKPLLVPVILQFPERPLRFYALKFALALELLLLKP